MDDELVGLATALRTLAECLPSKPCVDLAHKALARIKEK